MTITNVLERIKVPPTQQKKLLRRYEKLGILVNDGNISDQDAEKIIKDFKEQVCLNGYIVSALSDTEINGIRATSDIRCRLFSEGYPVKKFSDTTFATMPNTYYIHQDYLQDVDVLIKEYKEAFSLGQPFRTKTVLKLKTVGVKQDEKEKKEQEQKEKYIGIIDFLKRHQGWEILARKVYHRENFLFFLEDHEWFGIKCIPVDEIVYEKTKNNPYYICKSDMAVLDEKLEQFFSEYGLTGDQIFRNILDEHKGNRTLAMFEEFLNEERKSVYEKIPKRIANVARELSGLEKSIVDCSTEDVVEILNRILTVEGKSVMIAFTDWVRKTNNVAFRKIMPLKKQTEKTTGYNMSVYKGLCICVFYEEHIKENQMVSKALKDIRYVGMWMYVSDLMVFDLRGTDIEKITNFPDIRADKNWVRNIPRNADELERAILNDEISENDYISIGTWYVDTNEIKSISVQKTHMNEVIARLTPELLAHFGKLLLIGEVHHIRGANRFLDIKNLGSTFYSNNLYMTKFFGPKIKEILGRDHFKRLKMNHTVSQLYVQSALDLGMDSMTAISMATYARGHSNMNTMFHYVGDHSLTEVNAETVLWLMIERRVLGVVPYLVFLKYFPESFGKLSPKEQTELINLSGLSALEIESMMTQQNQLMEFKEAMILGDIDEPTEILKCMLAIGQGYGASTDKGTYCMKRALGMKCSEPYRGSCMASGCRYNVLTAAVGPAMTDMILEKQQRAMQGDIKAKAVLNTIIYPKFKKVRKYLKNSMPEDEFKLWDMQMKEALEVKQCS